MLTSYASTAARQLLRRKLYTSINLAGFALALAGVILIGVFVRHELGYDSSWRDAERIYRISADFDPAARRVGYRPAGNVQPAAPALAAEFADTIEQTARIWGTRVRLTHGADVSYEDDFRFADASFFDVFSMRWLRGDPATALAGPANVVLTASAAARYFGAEDPLGQTLLLEATWPLTVTGVIADLPPDTHLTASAIASFDAGFNVLGFNYERNWAYPVFHTYVRLRPDASIDSIVQRLPGFVERHKGPFDIVGMTATPLRDIHLHANRESELGVPGSAATITASAGIALCILLMACVNFTNLATARATTRAREVGMRKVLGATRAQLVAQFLGEAVLVAGLAMALATALAELALPAFGNYLGRTLALDYGDPAELAALAGFTLLSGLLAGAYPAFYLSAFESARVLAGDLTRGKSGARLRRGLVIVQFAIAVVLLIVTAVFRAQLDYARSVERGFETEHVVILRGAPAGLGPEWRVLEQRLLEHPEITHAVAGSMQPRDVGERPIRVEGGDPEGLEVPSRGVDYGFFDAYGIEVVAGRTFAEERATDELVLPSGTAPRTTGAYVLNELAVRELGLGSAEGALGKWLELGFATDFSRAVRGPIIGVVADTYIDSVRAPLQPIVYFAAPALWNGRPTFADASVRITGNRVRETLAYIDATWAEALPQHPLDRFFLDEAYAALLADEERQSQMLTAFAALSMAVACLGLIGLASFTTEQRTKEIGVRKALGGTLADIVGLFAGEFAKLGLLASVVAWPIAFAVTERWLDGFAYRIALSPLVFLASSGATLLLACAIVGAIAGRTALAKPIAALRHE